GRARQGGDSRIVALHGLADLGPARIAVPVFSLSLRDRDYARGTAQGGGGREAAACAWIPGGASALSRGRRADRAGARSDRARVRAPDSRHGGTRVQTDWISVRDDRPAGIPLGIA